MPVTVSVNTIDVDEPEQIVGELFVAFTVGIGFTTTIAVIDEPGQRLAVSVIVKVTVLGAFVVFVNDPLIFPAPLAPIPVTVPVSVLVHVYIVPPTLPVSAIGVIAVPEHMVCEGSEATALGVGLTSTVALIIVPVHITPALVKVGIIVKVTITGVSVVFVNAPLIFPAPLAPIPVTAPVLVLVQLYIVPTIVPLSTMGIMAVPEQMVCEEGIAIASGVGLTNIVPVLVKLPQPPVRVTVSL